MKPSFYFVLWQLAWLPTILLDIPFLNKNGLVFAFIIVLFADHIIKKLLHNQIEYQQMCVITSIMEMAYTNDYKKYKQQALLQMIVSAATFIYLLLWFIALFTSSSNDPLVDKILLGAFMILAGISSARSISLYLQVRKAGCVILDKELQEVYKSYKEDRNTRTYEEMLLPTPKYYQAMNTANVVIAMLCIVIGLLSSILLAYREAFPQFSEIVLTVWCMLAIYFGVKDLLSTLNSSKILLLIVSCLIAVLLSVPLANYLDKLSLEYYFSALDIKYDKKSNLVQQTIEVDDIKYYEPAYTKKHLMLRTLPGQKRLLEIIININAEYQSIFRDSLENELIIRLAPSELKEIYSQNKSDLEICLELLRSRSVSVGSSVKVYEDGENIIIELSGDNPVYPTKSEEINLSKALAEQVMLYADIYDIAALNRGLKMRLFFNDHQFIEHALSLEEIRKEKNNTTLDESENDSNGLIDLFSGNSTDN